MRVIRKYEITQAPMQTIEMPSGARILHIERGHVWALVNPNADRKLVEFRTFVTDEEFDEAAIHCDYRGTCILNGIAYHVVEVV